MKAVILDRNEAVLEYFSFLLKNFNIEIKTFSKKEECLKYLLQNEDTDFLFIEDFFYQDFLKDFVDTFFIILSFKIKELAVDNRICYFIKKDILPIEFKYEFEIIQRARKYFLQEKDIKIKLTKVISYKELQEEMATQKQLKLFKDDLSMFYENDFLIETYYKPKDILSGDAILTKRLDENRYFVAIIDAMGKGLSASLTSSNSIGFLNFAIFQALKHNNFDFHKIIKNFVDYVKSILIENEALCVVIGYIENNKFTFTNFGMPPIYVDRKKIRPNNMPLTEWSNSINIDSTEFKDDILLFSDGLIESKTKEGDIYLHRFKQLLPQFTFLSEIIKDFKKQAIQSDDTTLIYIKKDHFKFEKIYEKEINISSIEDIKNFLEEFDKLQIPSREKIYFTLQELLMNSYEHSMLKLKILKNALLKNNEVQLSQTQKKIKVKIILYKNKDFIKLHYSDSGEGFDIEILKNLSKDKLHGRGIKMIKFLSDAIFYNLKGNSTLVFFKIRELNI